MIMDSGGGFLETWGSASYRYGADSAGGGWSIASYVLAGRPSAGIAIDF